MNDNENKIIEELEDNEIDNLEEIEDIEEDEKTRKKDEKRRKKEERKELRKIKRAERKKKFIFFSKVVLTILIILFTGFLNSLCFTLLGFSRLAMLFVIPSIFIIPGLLIPVIWVKKGYKGVFFVIWLICALTYITGFVIPTLFMEYQTIAFAFDTLFDWFGGLFV